MQDQITDTPTQVMTAQELAQAVVDEISDILPTLICQMDLPGLLPEWPEDRDALYKDAAKQIGDSWSKRMLIAVDGGHPVFISKTDALRRLGFLLSGVYLSESDRKIVKAAMKL